jgi:hypothetical protein
MNSSFYALTSSEVAYTTATGVSVATAAGAVSSVGTLSGSSLSKLLVDADHVYALSADRLLGFDRH